MDKTSKLFFYITIPLVLLALGMVYFFINPSTFAYSPQCPFYSLTGFHCPGCGTQRALHDILHGHIWEGLQHNFLILLALGVLGYKIYVHYINTYSSQTKKDLLHHNASPWVILILILGFWVLRNLPLEPFLILAP